MYGGFMPARVNPPRMKRVRLTIRPVDTEIHPGYALSAGGAEYLSTVELINWNLTNEPIGLLFRVDGNREAFAADLDDLPQVVNYDITPIDEATFYIYVRDSSTPTTRQLIETFTRGSLIVVSPIEYLQDGRLTITVVGPASEIQAAVDGVPTDVEAEIAEVGGSKVSQDSVAARLSDRQHAAIVAGINVGYYEIPRQATHEDVAAAMGCASSTASEHLRKAESKLITALFT
jgi:predicted DNA binding protein